MPNIHPKTWSRRQSLSLEGPALTWLFKALLFIGLATALVSLALLLAGCVSPYQPIVGKSLFLEKMQMANTSKYQWRY